MARTVVAAATGRSFVAMIVVLTTINCVHGAAPDFVQDVSAVLSKAGCNMGACHGNFNGKGGFRLSLRGQDPADDHRTLRRGADGRRLNLLEPEQSLLIQKPLGLVPHQGGVRFTIDSPEYRILREWIAGGAKGVRKNAPQLASLEVTPLEQVVVEPNDRVSLRATAIFDDGTKRDVTELACYETSNLSATVDRTGNVVRTKPGEITVIVRYLERQVPVRLAFIPARTDFVWSDPPANNFIDEHQFTKLKKLRMNPSDLCDDGTFFRRVHLDCLGVLPTAQESKAFVHDASPDKRTRLIDSLLSRSEFADFWTMKWSDLLRNEEKVLDRRGVDAFHGWIRESIASGKPVDQFVRELVSSRGSTYASPESNFYRANRDPVTRAETTARLFLGVRLQCAKCHNHPFDTWKQDDYYNWAAWFSQIDYQILNNKRNDKFDKNNFNGEQIVDVLSTGEVTNPRTQADAPPKFLGSATPKIPDNADRATIAAEWLTSPKNKMFVRSQVNFVWYHLLGRGLVEPIDDVRTTNPASNPELFDALAADFVAHKFDLRHLVRTIVHSRTYQLSSRPNATNVDDEANFAKGIVRRLTAEQLLDAQADVLERRPRFGDYPAGTRAIQLKGTKRTSDVADGDRFLKMFGKPERLLACECERSNETTLNQAFLTLSDESLQQRLLANDNRLERLRKAGLDEAAILDDVYWSALGRAPVAEEIQVFTASLNETDDKVALLQDWTWGVLNSKEFLFRH